MVLSQFQNYCGTIKKRVINHGYRIVILYLYCTYTVLILENYRSNAMVTP